MYCNWGILGPGFIATRAIIPALQEVSNSRILAVASSNEQRAREVALRFSIERFYSDYQALLNDPDIDVVYIALPNHLHREWTIRAAVAGKHVLCEKPLAMYAAECDEMIAVCREANVFLMEAVWSKFLPQFHKAKELVASGELGEIRSVLVDFGFIPSPPVPPRLFDPALGGGSLLDIGIYNVFFALSFLGRPDIIEASMTPTELGIDEQCAVLFKYKNGAMAQLFSTLVSNTGTQADICGTKSRLRLTSRFYAPSATIELFSGREDSKKIIPVNKESGSGYQYEARHVGECLRKGLTESPVMTHADSLLIMETMDRIRAVAGIHYPADDIK